MAEAGVWAAAAEKAQSGLPLGRARVRRLRGAGEKTARERAVGGGIPIATAGITTIRSPKRVIPKNLGVENARHQYINISLQM